MGSASVEVFFQPNRRGAGTSLAPFRDRAKMTRIAPIRVCSFLLLAACGAFCQSEGSSADLPLRNGSNSPELQQELRTLESLPDAPSVQEPAQAERFHRFGEQPNSPLKQGAGDVGRQTELGPVATGLQPSFGTPYQPAFAQKESSTFVSSNPDLSLLRQNQLYRASTSNSFMGRATYAASRIFITRDDSGKERLNTSYFLQALASVASATASRPYWTRSASSTFNNFGSTIGSDAGLNVYREFGPGLRQVVRGHTPKFVSRIGNRITHSQTSSKGAPTSAR